MPKISGVRTPIKVRGAFHLQLIGDNGASVLSKNLIVDNGLAQIARWGIPGVSDEERPGFMSLGTGGHAEGDTSVPLPPTSSDISLETEVARHAIDDYDTSSGTLVMSCTFDNDVAVGELTEAGLFSADGKLLSRVTFSAVSKTSSLYALVTWSYSFANYDGEA